MPATAALICILDDDASVLRSIGRLLESDGLASLTFERAKDFLAYAQQHVVRLAVLDVCMPETSGLEVQTQLHEVSPSTGVIFMTGRDEPAVRSAALQNGALAFLSKPFEDERFLNLVHHALEQAN